MNLDSRQASIAQALLTSPKAVSASHLAKTLGVSPRVVRYNLPAIRCWFETRGARLAVGPRRGISLTAPLAVRQNLKAELRSAVAEARPSKLDRIHLLLLDLLTCVDYQTVPRLAVRLGSSRATLSRDLIQAQTWLSLKGLSLSTRPGQGTTVQGAEVNWRHALISLLYELGLESSLLELCLWRTDARSVDLDQPTPAQAAALGAVDAWQLQDAWRHIGEAAAELATSFAEMDHLFLALYWAVTLLRVRQDRRLASTGDRERLLVSLPEARGVLTAAVSLERETGIHLSEAELGQLALEFNTTSREVGPGEGEVREGVDLEVVEDLVRRIGLRLGRGLEDPEMLGRIAHHLTRVVARLRNSLPIHNPLTEDVRQTFPELWRATSQAVAHLQEELAISLPPQEIAFLTLYLALAFRITHDPDEKRPPRVLIACPSGGVTVSILRSRLQSEFPELEIVGVTSLKHLGKLDLSAVDAVIATAPVQARGTTVIVVNPLLPESNVARIRDVLGMARPAHPVNLA